jgi:hypothetical protein
MCDAGVVVKQWRVHAGVACLLISQQRSPVQIVTKQPIAVGEQFIRRDRQRIRRNSSENHDGHHRKRFGGAGYRIV